MDERENNLDKYAENRARSFVRTPLVLALLGLLFSVLYGFGALFSVVSLILSAVRYKKKKSETLRWAIVISAVTLFVCVLFWIGLIAVFAWFRQTT